MNSDQSACRSDGGTRHFQVACSRKHHAFTNNMALYKPQQRTTCRGCEPYCAGKIICQSMLGEWMRLLTPRKITTHVQLPMCSSNLMRQNGSAREISC
mmetsp:Transcript_13574/g.44347  ORF Transcript_13574/g.44347 Transcript_13574/m.44347 type:complete len:98 (+) Transcript_13574:8854-9147(+)